MVKPNSNPGLYGVVGNEGTLGVDMNGAKRFIGLVHKEISTMKGKRWAVPRGRQGQDF